MLSFRSLVDGIRYLAAIHHAVSARARHARVKDASFVKVDIPLPPLGIEKLFGHDGTSLVRSAGGFTLFGLVGLWAVWFFFEAFAAHGLAVLLHLLIAVAAGAFAAHMFRNDAKRFTSAGEEALALIPRADLEKLQHAIGLHEPGTVLPSTVLTYLEAALYAVKLRHRLADKEKAKLQKVRELWR